MVPLWRSDLDDYPTAGAFSPDGSLFAIGTSAGRLIVLDAATGEHRWSARPNPGGVLGVTASARRFATSGQDGTAKLYDLAGKQLAELPGTSGWSEHVAFAPDGRGLATASGKHVRIWNEDGMPLLETQAHPSTVAAVQWSRTGTELATCCYGGAYIWEVERGSNPKHLPFKGSLISLAWSPDNRVIACGSQDCSVHFWRMSSGNDSEMTGYPFKPKALAWDANSTMLATGGDAKITVWNFSGKGPEGTAPIQLSAHKAQVTQLAFNPRKAILVSGAQDMGVIVWEPRKGTQPVTLGFVGDSIEVLLWSPRAHQFVTADASGSVTAWPAPLCQPA
jgi:WD40 repeat protein